jgi:uncharacterized membrane protein
VADVPADAEFERRWRRVAILVLVLVIVALVVAFLVLWRNFPLWDLPGPDEG